MSRLLLLSLLTELVFLVVAVVSLVWPQKIQQLALWQGAPLLIFNPFRSWTMSRSYIWSLRIIGVLALVGAIIIGQSIFRYLSH
jgi:predicted permease